MAGEDHNWSFAKRLIIATVGMVLLAVGAAGFRMLQLDRFEHQSLVPISDDISLGVAAILTSDNKNFSIPTFRTRVYGGLPKWGRHNWIKSGLGFPVPAKWSYFGDPDHVELAMYYRIPATWHLDDGDMELKLGNTTATEFLSLRARYDNGWHSSWRTLWSHGVNNVDVPDVVPIDSNPAFAIPVNQEYFDVLVFNKRNSKTAFSGNRIGSFRLKNPTYENVEPLQAAQELPIKVSKAGVAVSLKAFVSKARTDDIWNRFQIYKARLDSVRGEDFVRAEGTFADAYGGMAAFTVDEAGTSTSQWVVDEAKISYGKKLHPFRVYTRATQSANLFVYSYGDDPGMLQQAVKFTISLKRGSRFLADEVQKVEIPLPAAGTLHCDGSAVQFWNGRGSLNVRFTRQSLSSMLQISLECDGSAANAEVQKMELLGDNGAALDLAYNGGTSWSSVNTTIAYYVPKETESYLADKKFLEKDTTLSMTLVNPRSYPHEFEFIAEPMEATGKMQVGGFLEKLFGGWGKIEL